MGADSTGLAGTMIAPISAQISEVRPRHKHANADPVAHISSISCPIATASPRQWPRSEPTGRWSAPAITTVWFIRGGLAWSRCRQRLNIHCEIDLQAGQTRMLHALTVDVASTTKLPEAIGGMYPKNG
jgi:hypothetical protein